MMALQLALTKANPRRLYSPKISMILDLGSFSMGKATCKLRKGRHCCSTPTPISLDHKWGADPTQFLTLPIIGVVLSVLGHKGCRTCCHARFYQNSVDVMDKSKAAGLPRSRLGTRASAGQDCELDPCCPTAHLQRWTQASTLAEVKKKKPPGAYYGAKPYPFHACLQLRV